MLQDDLFITETSEPVPQVVSSPASTYGKRTPKEHHQSVKVLTCAQAANGGRGASACMRNSRDSYPPSGELSPLSVESSLIALLSSVQLFF